MMGAKEQVIHVLKELQEDNSVSKNIKQKVSAMQSELEGCSENDLSLTVNKILCDLEELSSDVNLPPFIRTQILHISGMLETIC